MNNFKNLLNEGSGITWSTKDGKEINDAANKVVEAYRMVKRVYKRTKDSDLESVVKSLEEMVFDMETVGEK